MQPVVRGHTADANVPTAQNFLPDKRDHYGVIHIVICGVAGRDIFKSKLGDKADHARIVVSYVRSYIVRSSRMKASITIKVALNM